MNDSKTVTSTSFVHQLRRTLDEANRFLIDALKKTGLSSLAPSHGDILQALFKAERVTMQELAQDINRDPSTVTALVKKLNTLGYTQTRKCPTDQRVTEVMLTKAGQGLKAEMDSISASLIETQMRGLTEEEVSRVMVVLQKMQDNFAQANEDSRS